MTSPTADLSVRVAWADDAEAIAAMQRARLADGVRRPVARPMRITLDPDTTAQAWRAPSPPPATRATACWSPWSATAWSASPCTSPATDPDCDPVADGELQELTVAAGERGKGHGSRLLQAAVDTLRADRFTRAVLWTVASDDDLRRFLTDAGWAPDSAHRELDLDGTGTTTVKQVRLHTAL